MSAHQPYVHPHTASTAPTFFYGGKDGIDPVHHHSVPHTKVDFQSTMWSYENCACTFDHPVTIKTKTLGKESFAYAFLKLVPGLYVCTVKGDGRPNCRLEILQRVKDYDTNDNNNWQNKVVHRHGCLCTSNATDLKLLVTGDTDAEVRIVFDPHQDLRVPSFRVMEVRARRHIAMPLKTRIHTGLYKPKPMRYGSLDVHRMLKKIHYVINWLKELDEHLNDVLRLVTNPLWDVDVPTSAFDYTQSVQSIQNALSTELPCAFVARSYCFSVFLFPQVKVPLLSQTLVKELTQCINADPVDKHKLASVFRHALKYINFMMVEYTEFKRQVATRLSAMRGKAEERWNVVRVEV